MVCFLSDRNITTAYLHTVHKVFCQYQTSYVNQCIPIISKTELSLIAKNPTTVQPSSVHSFNLSFIHSPPDYQLIDSLPFQKSSRFTEALIPYRNAGLSIGICSGSGAWSNLTGSPEAMVMNVLSANYSAHKLHATALVNVNWASDPALNHFVFSWPGFLLSAGLAWNPLAQQVRESAEVFCQFTKY